MKLGGKNIRTRCQSLIDNKILVDYPADTYMHVLSGLPLTKIHTYLITHSHSDHLYTPDFAMRGKWFATIEKEEKVNVYADRAAYVDCAKEIGIDPWNERMEAHYIVPFKPFEVEGYTVTALRADHGLHTTPVIFLIEKDGKCVLHSHDTGYYPRETWEYLEKNKVHIDFASFDCTEPLAEKDNPEKSNHMNYCTVLNVRNKLIELGYIDDTTICAVNHFSHNGKMTHEDIEELVTKDGFIVAYDGLEVEF